MKEGKRINQKIYINNIDTVYSVVIARRKGVEVSKSRKYRDKKILCLG